MNKIYALVWNPAQECWNVVSENSSRRGKRSSKRRLAVALSLLGLVALEPAYALPTGQNIVSGQGNISTNGQQMTINQQSDKLITQWDGFSVGSNESVTFHQPGSNSVALNRVVGVNGSDIQGKIDANGKVFLLNPNGVVFGKNAQVNVGELVASTRDISNADFLVGKNRFVGKSQAEVRNDGTLTAAQAGSVALLGARVSNQGVIYRWCSRLECVSKLQNVKASGDVQDLAAAKLGGLVGFNSDGEIKNAQAENSVIGGNKGAIGGLIGANDNGIIAGVSTKGMTVGGADSQVGGVIGRNKGDVTGLHAEGGVSAGNGSAIGGLIGVQDAGKVANVTANSTVKGGNNALVGGLIGKKTGGDITNAVVQGSATGGENSRVGGLVGAHLQGTISRNHT